MRVPRQDRICDVSELQTRIQTSIVYIRESFTVKKGVLSCTFFVLMILMFHKLDFTIPFRTRLLGDINLNVLSAVDKRLVQRCRIDSSVSEINILLAGVDISTTYINAKTKITN